MKINRNAAIAASLVVVLVCSLVFLAMRSTKAAQPEVIPTAQQQQPVKDLLAEKEKLIKQKEAEIGGAIKMLMSQLVDPTSGKTGLDPNKWTPQGDGLDGFKFVQVQPQIPPAASTLQGGTEGANPKP